MNKPIPSNELSILFLSCDKYQDLWKPFFYCINKYFKQDVYPVYLGSNTLSYNDKKITTLLSGKDRDWSSSLLAILNQITVPYIYIWLDDIFPISTVNMQYFSNVFQFMKQRKAKHIHPSPSPRPDYLVNNGAYGIYEKGAPYTTTVIGFWDVEYLKKLLIPGESPWNFEVMGSYRSTYADGFYCTMKPMFQTLHVIEKGWIFREAYDYCQTHSIPLSATKRSILTNTYRLKSEIQKCYFIIVINIPWKLRLALMNILRKLLISY